MEIFSAAAAEARRLQQPIAGPEFVLLALLRLEGCDAANILRDLGVDAAELERKLTSREHDADDDATSIIFPPIMYTLAGRVEASRVALGDGHATAEHALLALMWDTRPVISPVNGRDVRLSILERLAAAGHRIPSVEPPPLAPAITQRVVLDDARDADAVLEHLVQSHLDGWGWNVNEHGTRWFVAPAHIDLLELIEQVIGRGRARDVGLATRDRDLV